MVSHTTDSLYPGMTSREYVLNIRLQRLREDTQPGDPGLRSAPYASTCTQAGDTAGAESYSTTSGFDVSDALPVIRGQHSVLLFPP